MIPGSIPGRASTGPERMLYANWSYLKYPPNQNKAYKDKDGDNLKQTVNVKMKNKSQKKKENMNVKFN